MREPGVEPGSQPWQGRILTTGLLALNQAREFMFLNF